MDMTSTIPPNVEAPYFKFSGIDYSIFAIMLGFSLLIGIYHGYYGNKHQTAIDYLLGGKTMSVFPISMSLIASHLSGVALLAIPADVYSFGAAIEWNCLAMVITSFISIYVFIPVFLKLGGTSIYEYLQLRFDNRIRILASFLGTLSTFLYSPIVIYIPALAFSQVTGINLHVITPTLCIICTFYTTIGGLRAVVWTDTLQTLAIVLAAVVVLILGIISNEGFSNIWTQSITGHRLDVFKAIIIFCIGIVSIHTIDIFIGLTMFAKYSDCDPLSTKQVLRSDQLLPYFVIDVSGRIPGLPGLFIAGVIGAGLSTLSTLLNSLACNIYEDFISPFMTPNITQKKIRNIMKLIIVIIGAISTASVFVVEQLGGVLPLYMSIGGITSGPLVGLFSLGILFPFANSKGALVGGIGGLLLNSWMIIGNMFYEKMGLLENFSKPLSTEGCSFYVNATSRAILPPSEPVFVLYRISFWYYTMLGAIVVIIIGLIVSLITNKDENPVDPELISPAVHILISKTYKRGSLPARSEYLQVGALNNSKTDNEENA